MARFLLLPAADVFLGFFLNALYCLSGLSSASAFKGLGAGISALLEIWLQAVT